MFAALAAVAQRAGPDAARAAQDTIAAVFGEPEYGRSAQRTVGALIWEAFARTVGRIFDAFDRSPFLRTVALWGGGAVLVLIVLRVLYVAAQRDRMAAHAGRARGDTGATARDPWLAAQRAAAEGRYTDAAHLLYAALLQRLARHERLRLHPSKTAGDYARELRTRSSPAAPPFRQFVRAFEYVAYGTRTCDEAQSAVTRARWWRARHWASTTPSPTWRWRGGMAPRGAAGRRCAAPRTALPGRRRSARRHCPRHRRPTPRRRCPARPRAVSRGR
jgi:hypothetical protein